jgi:hypothetical protein
LKLVTAILAALNAGLAIYLALKGSPEVAAFNGAVAVFCLYLGKDYE